VPNETLSSVWPDAGAIAAPNEAASPATARIALVNFIGRSLFDAGATIGERGRIGE
jgi:hypothetical protein